jgi:hypothetical protein
MQPQHYHLAFLHTGDNALPKNAVISPQNMKKYLPYILVILVLAGAAAWFITTQTKGTLSEEEGNFAVKDKEKIAKIVMTDTENRKVELTNAGGTWMLNGEYVARPDLIGQLMESVTRVVSLCPVPKAAHDNVVREMMGHHVKTEIYDIDGELLRSYWVGGPSVDGLYTYMLLEMDGKPAHRPQMAYIPGVKGYLTYRYSTDAENWRSKQVFNYTTDDIKELSVQYTANEQNSFVIKQVAPDSFTVSPTDEKYRINEPYQQKYIRQYLGFYASVFIETFDNKNPAKDSIAAGVPYCIIRVTGKDNEVNEVRLFYMPINRRSKSQFDEQGRERTIDIERAYASLNKDRDFGIVQYYVFGTLLRNYKDFYFKPPVQPAQ